MRLCSYTDVYYHDAITADMSFMPATAPLAQVRRFALQPDDVLVTKDSETAADIAVAARVRDQLPGVLCGYHLAILRPLPHVAGRFLLYALQSWPLAAQTEVAASGVTRFALSTGALASLTLPVPRRAEQLAIADFLDRETEKIDALVAKKQRLIELLQEKRTALISHAVTKGLDPDVPMKDSGIEWLGQIPERWRVSKMGRVAKVANGSTPSRERPEFWEDGSIPWLNSGKVNEEVIVAADQYVTPQATAECHLPPIGPGSVLVAITGEGKTRGRAALLTIQSATSQHLAALQLRDSAMNSKFLWRYLQSRYWWLRQESSGGGSTKAAITCEMLQAMPLVHPPLDEQTAVADYLDRALMDLKRLEKATAAGVGLLLEYRAALITAAVTGQIDVRTYRQEAS